MAGGGAAPAPEGADDILGLFRRIQEERRKAADAQGSKDSFVSEENDKKKETPVNVLVDITKLFVFSDFSEITRLANTLQGFYQGNNDLYKNEAAHKYYLLVSKSRQTPEEFNKVCNILSEYGTQQTYTPAAGAFMKEHYQVILKNQRFRRLQSFKGPAALSNRKKGIPVPVGTGIPFRLVSACGLSEILCKEIVDLFYQSVRIDTVYHGSLFYCLHLGRRASKAVHSNI